MITMSGTGPRFGRRTDTNHTEIRNVIKDCAKAFPEMHIKYVDTSNAGGRFGDFIIQFWRIAHFRRFETHLLEVKKDSKAKYTDSQEKNPLELYRIETRADIFDLLGRSDWELI